MLFARFIPDWNSLDSVRRAHSDLELAALAFFFLLVLFDVLAHLSDDKNRERLFEKIGLWFFAIAVASEIAAYPYGQRNDTLAGAQIGSLDAKANDASEKAAKAVKDSDDAETKSGNALDQADKAGGAARKAEDSASLAQQHTTAIGNELKKEIEREQAAEKQLEEEKAKRLKLAASLLPRQIFDSTGTANQLLSISPPRRVVLAYLNESEPRDLTEQIAGIGNLLHWNVFRRPILEDDLPNGVCIFPGKSRSTEITPGEERDRAAHTMWDTQKFAESLAAVLTRQGIASRASFVGCIPSPEIDEPSDTLVIEIGRKPEYEAEEAIHELGPAPQITPFAGTPGKGAKIGTERIILTSIPLEDQNGARPNPIKKNP